MPSRSSKATSELMCVTPAGKIGNCTWGIPNCCNIQAKKHSSFPSYQSKTVGAFGAAYAATEGPSLDINGYGLLDVAAGLESPGKHWQVQVWGKNVTNTYYWTSVFYESDTVVRDTGMPSTYGVTVSYHW